MAPNLKQNQLRVRPYCSPATYHRPKILARNFTFVAAAAPKGNIAKIELFLGCSVHKIKNPFVKHTTVVSMWISFEFYILKIYLVCWFPHHLGDFFYRVGKTSNLAKRIASLVELLLTLNNWGPSAEGHGVASTEGSTMHNRIRLQH
jgi:hypothetical protein